MSIDVGKAIGYLDLDTSSFQKGFQSALKELNAFKDETATLSDKVSGVGRAMTSAGSTLTKGVTIPLVGAGTAIMAVGNKFEAQMSRVQGISGATEAELKSLTDQAIELGAKTSFSATEAAEGMENLASAGFTTNEIMQAMPGLLDLAASSGADLATASEIAASAVRGFGLEASDTAHVADVFAEAAARTNAQTEDMGEAMKYIAPVAKAMGQSLEMTAAAVGIMSDAGIKGSQAGTSLRGALSRLAKPTEAMTKTMEKLGLEFYDAQGNMLPLDDIIGELESSMAGLTQEQRNNALVTLFGQESLSGMLALIERGPDELSALSKSFEEADGAAGDMADTMLDNTSGSIEEMMGSIETLAIKLQQVLAPTVTAVVKKITEFVNFLSSLDEDTLKFITTVGMVAAAVGPVLLIGGKLITGIVSVMNAISSLKGVMTALQAAFAAITGGATGLSGVIAALLSPIGLVIAGVAALTAAWVTNFGGIRDKTKEILDSISQIISAVLEFVTGLWENNFLGIQDIVKQGWALIERVFSDALDLIVGVFEVFSLLFQGKWDEAFQRLIQLLKDFVSNFIGQLTDWLNLIVDSIIRIGVRLWDAGSRVFSQLKDGFLQGWNSIISWFEWAKNDPVNAVLSIGNALYNAGVSIFNSLWNGIESVWNGLRSWVSDAVDWIRSKVAFWQSESAKVSSGGYSHASGLDYVPYNGYPAILHQGERVLTQEEVKNGVGSGFPENFTINIPLYVNGKKFAQATAKDMNKELGKLK